MSAASRCQRPSSTHPLLHCHTRRKNNDLHRCLCKACASSQSISTCCILIPSNLCLQSALQYYNATSWGATMLSLTSVDPTEALNLGSTCKQRLGTFCLDNSSLSVSAAEAIIGIGCFVVIMLICIPCVFLEWRRRSGRVSLLPLLGSRRFTSDSLSVTPIKCNQEWHCVSGFHNQYGRDMKGKSPTASLSTVLGSTGNCCILRLLAGPANRSLPLGQLANNLADAESAVRLLVSLTQAILT